MSHLLLPEKTGARDRKLVNTFVRELENLRGKPENRWKNFLRLYSVYAAPATDLNLAVFFRNAKDVTGEVESVSDYVSLCESEGYQLIWTPLALKEILGWS